MLNMNNKSTEELIRLRKSIIDSLTLALSMRDSAFAELADRELNKVNAILKDRLMGESKDECENKKETPENEKRDNTGGEEK